MSVLLRESCDKIHRNLLKGEGAFFGCNAVKRRFSLMSQDFILLAGSAAFDVICDPLSHPCPGQDLRGFSYCFVSSRVSCGRVIMDERHQVPFRGLRYLRIGGAYKEFRLEQGLIFIVVVSVV